MSLADYMNLPYSFVIKQITDESGAYFHATVLELDGCQSAGETFQDAYEGLREAMEGWIETKLKNGFPVPLPVDSESYNRKKEGTDSTDNLAMEQDSVIELEIDETLKKEADAIFSELGLDAPTAIRIFLKQIIMRNGLPFDVTQSVPNAETIAALEEADRISRDPSAKRYNNFSELLAEVQNEV